MRASLTPIALIFSCFILLLLGIKTEPAAIPVPLYKPETRTAEKPRIPRLIESSLGLGLAHEHRQNTVGLSSFIDTLGAGACFVDVNQDGWLDLFLAGGNGTRRHYGRAAWWANDQPVRLLMNNAGRFEDKTEMYGLDTRDFASMGCSVADLNGDSRDEILLFGEGKLVLFEIGTEGLIRHDLIDLGPEVTLTSASAFDVNQDKQLDVYVTGFVLYSPGKNVLEKFSGFQSDGDAAFDPGLYDAAANLLLLNQGDFNFSDASSEFAVSNQQGRSLFALPADVNQDGLQDLVVANGFATPNKVFVRTQTGFEEGAATALAMPGSRSAAQIGSNRWLFSRQPGVAPAMVEFDHVWQDRSRERGLGGSESLSANSWGLAVGDLNLDGIEDVVVANGHLAPDTDAPLTPSGQANQILLGTADGRFQPISFGQAGQSSRSVSLGDVDNDGDLDVLVANNNGRFLLYENQTVATDWISFDFSGHSEPITVRVADQDITYEPRFSLFSQSAARRQFQLPAGANSVSVEVVVRNKKVLSSTVLPNKVYRVQSDGSLAETELLPRKLSKQSEFNLLARYVARSRDAEALEHYLPDLPLPIVLSELELQRDAFTARLIQLGLSSRDTDSQLRAIEMAKQAELEWSVDWLIPLLSSSEEVSCAASRVFEHFFEEEEIAIVRKYLAVKTLMKTALRGDEAARCAISALGASEKKRSLPLLHDLVRGTDSAQTAAAVEALGRIRDTASIPVLREKMQQSNAATILTEAVIALSRLGEPKLGFQLLAEKPSSIRFNVFSGLAGRAVISQAVLIDQIRVAARTMIASDRPDYLAAVVAVRDRPLNLALGNLDRDQDPAAVRLEVQRQQRLTDRAMKLTDEQLMRLLNDEPGVRVSPQQLVELVERNVEQALVRRLISRLSQADLSQVFASILDRDLLQPFMMDACANAGSSPVDQNVASLMLQEPPSSTLARCALYGSRLDNARRVSNRILIRNAKQTLSAQQHKLLVYYASQLDPFYQADTSDPDVRRAYISSDTAKIADLTSWLDRSDLANNERMQLLIQIAKQDPDLARQRFRDKF